MRIATVSAASLTNHARLDSRFFLAPGVKAAERVVRAKERGVPCVPLGDIAHVWQPNRFKRAYASESEESAPYLRPYDIFEYLPRAADLLSVKRNKGIASYILKRGMILQSCSGRNLGPAVFVDSYLARFVASHDLVRIEIEEEDLRNYVLAYLQSQTGQQLLTQGKFGSVIDHLSTGHVAQLEIPLLDHNIRTVIARKAGDAIRLREEARLSLDAALAQYEESLPTVKRARPERKGWTVKAKDLTGRLDAASYDPLVAKVRKRLIAQGGVPVASVATVLKPGGRPKTLYVDPAYGHPVLSGTQLLQARPINLSYMPKRAYKNPAAYEVRKGWIAYQADGRAEDALGVPVVITSDRDGWFASGHVGRLINNDDVDPGWLYLAVRNWAAQIQLKSLASGSVVDSTFSWDMERVILPPPDSVDGSAIQDAWEKFARAQCSEDEALYLVEQSLGGGGDGDTLHQRVKELADKWRQNTGHLSSIERKIAHPAYQAIIALGQPAIPFVLQELREHGGHWFSALYFMTGIDPTKEGDNVESSRAAWLAWGRRNGLLPSDEQM